MTPRQLPLANKRTNVRILNKSPVTLPQARTGGARGPIPSLARAALRGLARVAPGAAEATGAYLFSLPPRVRAAPPPAVSGVTPVRTRLRLERHGFNVWQWGNGPAVLLVHGWGGNVAQ